MDRPFGHSAVCVLRRMILSLGSTPPFQEFLPVVFERIGTPMSQRISNSTRLINTVDGAVVMEIKSGLMFTSDPVGGRILELLKQSIPEDQIIETVSRECEVSAEVVRPDLANFMSQLRSYGLVETEMPSA